MIMQSKDEKILFVVSSLIVQPRNSNIHACPKQGQILQEKNILKRKEEKLLWYILRTECSQPFSLGEENEWNNKKRERRFINK